MREWTWAWGGRVGYFDPRCSHPSETDASGRVGQALEFTQEEDSPVSALLSLFSLFFLAISRCSSLRMKVEISLSLY